ncbi:unnamed protein product [Arabis nemorensis]|uniref:Uncharacterized protein n=1 Tax=Arabis nemorensis TaxID=586526 RepID=A0A565BIS5_9BRAS|nr:unnamed protein product [Arabis nemorensis]
MEALHPSRSSLSAVGSGYSSGLSCGLLLGSLPASVITASSCPGPGSLQMVTLDPVKPRLIPGSEVEGHSGAEVDAPVPVPFDFAAHAEVGMSFLPTSDLACPDVTTSVP